MSSTSNVSRCERAELVALYLLTGLDRSEAESMAAHLESCADCQKEYNALRPVTRALAGWRMQSLPPPTSLWSRVTQRIADATLQKSNAPAEAVSAASPWSEPPWPEPEWREVAPGISCKLLSTDVDMDRVSMLVQLAPGASYPPHRHAGVEELYLLRGELWIDERKLSPGDYNRAECGTADQRVWSETGCMCLLITSPSDQLS
jgi:anti-sigma factor ChrR (cupin superfamily)